MQVPQFVASDTRASQAALARELGMCFAGLALITDYDAGVHPTDVAVDMVTVLAVLRENVTRLKSVLRRAVAISERPGAACGCVNGAPTPVAEG